MSSKLDGFITVEEQKNDTNKLFKFIFPDHVIFVAWNDEGEGILSLDMGKVKITDSLGTVKVSDSRRLNLTKIPVFIERIGSIRRD